MHRSWSGWIASAALLVAWSGPSSHADDPPARTGHPPWDSAAVEAFAQALAAGDEAGITRIARASDVDPVALAYGMWLRGLGEPRADGTQPPAAGEAARRVLRLVQ